MPCHTASGFTRLIVLRRRLREIIRGILIARDVDGIHQVRALVHQRLARQAQAGIHRLDVDVNKLQAGTRHLAAAVQRRDDVVLGRAGEVLPGDVGDLELYSTYKSAGSLFKGFLLFWAYLRCVAHGRISAINTLRDIDRQSDVVQLEVSEGHVLRPATSTTPVVAVGVLRCWHALPCLNPAGVV